MRNILGGGSVLLLSVGLVLAACGGGSNDGDDDANPGGGSGANDAGGGATNDGGGNTEGGTSTGDDGGKVVTNPPTHAPTSARFVDIDIATGTVGGNLVIGKSADESDVTSYAVYATDASGTKSGSALGEVPATGKDVVFKIAEGTAAPAAGAKLLVVSKNAAGEMATGPTSAYADATMHTVSLAGFFSGSPTANAGSGITVDTKNQRLLITSFNGIFFDCAMDGSSCKSTSVLGTRDSVEVWTKPFIEKGSGKAVVVVQTGVNFNGAIATTTLDGVADPVVDFTDPTVSKSGVSPGAAYDPVSGHMFAVVNVGDTTQSNPANLAYTSVLYDCTFGPFQCVRHNIALGTTPAVQAANAGYQPSVTFDSASKSLVVVTDDQSNANQRPFTLFCSTTTDTCSGRNDVFADVSYRAFTGPFAIDDAVSGKVVLVAQANGSAPIMVRCAADGTSCSAPSAMSAGTATTATLYDTAATVDALDGKVVAIGSNGIAKVTPDQHTLMYRCNEDGSGCQYFDLGMMGPYGRYDLTTDPTTGQLFVVTGGVPTLVTWY